MTNRENHINNTRRTLLRIFACLGTIVFPGINSTVVSARNSDRLEYKLTEIFTELESAKRIGNEYLRITPEESDIDFLVDRVCNHEIMVKNSYAASDRNELKRIVTRQSIRDFEAGRIVHVHGWLLSETEARLCAITALI